MKFPITASRIGRSFEPSQWSNNVVPAVAIYVSYANAVPIASRTHPVFHKRAVADFKPGQRILHLMAAPLRKNFARLAIVVQVHQEAELDAVAVFDQVLFPFAAFRTRVFVPPDAVSM